MTLITSPMVIGSLLLDIYLSSVSINNGVLFTTLNFVA